MGFMQYLSDTKGEMHHVSWPTKTQTAVFTVLVAAISAFVAIYLGVFDLTFTRALSEALKYVPGQSSQQVEQPLEVGNIQVVPATDTPVDSAPASKTI